MENLKPFALSVAIISVVVLVFFGAFNLLSKRGGSGNTVTYTYDVKDFDAVEISWETVKIKQTSKWFVEVTGSEQLLSQYEPEVNNGVLYFKHTGNKRKKIFDIIKSDVHVVVHAPKFASIDIDGVGSVEGEGLQGDSLIVGIHGAGGISLEGLGYDKVYMTVDGAGDIDTTNLPTKNAELFINGAGNIEVTMNGGELNAVIDGLGSIYYGGVVSNVEQTLNGLGTIKRLD